MQADSATALTVNPDHYEIAGDNRVLQARLDGSFAVCFYDAVFESGGLVHLRAQTPGKSRDVEVTDTTLANNLVLIDRCLKDLQRLESRAQHWQARLLGQVGDGAAARAHFNAMQDVIGASLSDAKVRLVSCELLDSAGALVRFNASMGTARIQTEA